ncbi:free fatty acid receptor 2-like [Pleuronectes platessa]|uniref:free fatty acid receptor 2-like n=1 Tax=Pleuronectes platessa TaxID=8262 RepID=UPI00232A1890|nr:free fatty acid receptor 2-like [Pleuronectes platessa]
MMLYSHLLLFVYILTFLMGVPANILAFCTFCRKVRRKANPIDILLLNLTISDLIFLLFLPFKLKEASDDMAWLLPFPLCPFTSFLFYVTIYNSTLLLTAVSVERYLGVAFPLRYAACRRPRYAVMASVAFWLVSSLNLSMVYIIPHVQWSKGSDGENPNGSSSAPPLTCYHNFSPDELEIILPFRLELFIVLFCIPFFICCYCYVNFILILSHLPNIGRLVWQQLPRALRTFAQSQSQADQWTRTKEYRFPILNVSPAVRQWREESGRLLTLRTPALGTFNTSAGKQLYCSCVKVLNCRSLAGVRGSRWTEVFGSDYSPSGSRRASASVLGSDSGVLIERTGSLASAGRDADLSARVGLEVTADYRRRTEQECDVLSVGRRGIKMKELIERIKDYRDVSGRIVYT